jgi:hypothetical protein
MSTMNKTIDTRLDAGRIDAWTKRVSKLDQKKREEVVEDINQHVQEWKDHGHTDQWLDYAIGKLFTQHGVP